MDIRTRIRNARRCLGLERVIDEGGGKNRTAEATKVVEEDSDDDDVDIP